MTFDTRVKIVLVHGDAAKKIAARLEAAGAEIISKPQAFLVQGREGLCSKASAKRPLPGPGSLPEFRNRDSQFGKRYPVISPLF